MRAIARDEAMLPWILKSFVLWYGCVALFANGFVLRGELLNVFPRAFVDNIGLLIAAAAMLGGFAWVGRRRKVLRASPGALGFFLLAVVCVLAGLASVDPAFPAKRIHVAQYFALSWLVYWRLDDSAGTGTRAFATVLITSMLGGLDEMAQGVMVQRFFGLNDILTNTCGALAGVAALLGLHRMRGAVDRGDSLAPVAMAAPLALYAGFILSCFALYWYRGLAFPPWIALPLVGGMVVVLSVAQRHESHGALARIHISIGAIAATALVGGAYVQALAIDFL